MLTDASRRADFPALDHMTYLNSAAEGIPSPAVAAGLAQYARDKMLGMDGRPLHFAQLEAAKELTGKLYGLSASEIAICSCSSEAFNLAAMALHLQAGEEVVINDLDFPAGATPWLQARSAGTVRLWKSRQGALQVDDLIPLLNAKTRLVSTSLVSFFNGFMIPLGETLAAVRKHSPALFALDVTQALGRIPLTLEEVDLIVSSTHKWILASHGGGLVGVPARRAKEWTVPAGGWYNLLDPFGPGRFDKAVSQEGAASFTVGMPNFPAIYAIRGALDYLLHVGVSAIATHADPLTRHCLEEVSRLPVELLTPRDPNFLAGILAFRHPQADALHKKLHERNIHVMSHAGRLRVAVHGYNTHRDVERFLSVLKEALKGV